MNLPILSSIRLDVNSDFIQTHVEKTDTGYLLTQSHGGYHNYQYDKIVMTEQEFNSMFNTVWVVESSQDDDTEIDYGGLFYSKSSAINKVMELIKCEVECKLEERTFYIDGIKLMAYEYRHGGNLFTAYEMRVSQ